MFRRGRWTGGHTLDDLNILLSARLCDYDFSRTLLVAYGAKLNSLITDVGRPACRRHIGFKRDDCT